MDAAPWHGNGRVGRLIAFKECLGHNIVPFLIEDRKKGFLLQGTVRMGKGEGVSDRYLSGWTGHRKRILSMLGID